MTTFQLPASLAPLAAEVSALARARDIAVFAVGGTVRDALLGGALHDVDIATERDALAFARALADALGGHFVELSGDNAIARIVLDGGPMRHIDVAELDPGGLAADLRRRDFTIDALAAPVEGGAVTDVTGGLADLAAGVVRMTSEQALDDDPLRLLRGVRIAAELTFALDAETLAAIVARAPRLAEAAAERRRDELARILALDAVYPALRLLDDCALLEVLLPEVTFGRGVLQPKDHAYDVFEHGLFAVEALDRMLAVSTVDDQRGFLREGLWQTFGWCRDDLRAYLAEELSEGRSRQALLKLAGVLHDVAKPQTRTVEADGRIRFLGHADEGAKIAARVMRRLRFSSVEVRFVTRLVAEHLRPVQLAAPGEVPTRRALYRFYRDLGDAVPGVLLLSLADAAAARGAAMTSSGWATHVQYMNSLLVRSMKDEGILDPPRLLTGHDIMSRFGVGAGPLIGRLLEALREAQAVGDVTGREEALAFVAERIAEEGPQRP